MIAWARDDWFGEDKLTHGVWCYAGTLTLLHVGVPWLLAALLVLKVGLLVEAIQGARWNAGLTTFAELPSYRDLAWDVLGILLGLVL